MKDKNYTLEEEITINLDSIIKVRINDLGLSSKYDAINKIKNIIAKEIDCMLRLSPSLSPIKYSVDVIENNFKSFTKITDKDIDL
jgi:hypothetical protein